MALIFHTQRTTVEDHNALVRRLDHDDYDIAITFDTDSEGEEDVTEVLLTKEEITEAYDLLFNR